MRAGLEKLNQASAEAAETAFLSCCGARRWAREMTEARPFAEFDQLLKEATQIWLNLEAHDWLEAFSAHPKIGERKAVAGQPARSREWSQSEQVGAATASDFLLAELAEANRLYEEKFGYIFIVCATGKSAEEMLALCLTRLKNAPEAELRQAAEEQRKITEIRLKKLLEAGI